MSSVSDLDRDEARYETRRAMSTGEYDRPHPLDCDCRQCLRDEYEPEDAA